MTNDVVLRPVADSDLPIFFEHQLDPIAARMAAFDSREWPAFVEHWKKIRADVDTRQCTVLVDERVVGNVGAWGPKAERMVGYWIGREFWGRGVASRALAKFVELETTRPLIALVAEHNLGSIRVLEKCGFERVARRTGAPCREFETLEEFVYELAAAPAR